MRKSFKFYIAFWVLLLVLFNVLVFVTPSSIEGTNISKFEGAFLVGYISVILGFVGQLVCSIFAFKETNNQRFFYKLPLITISYSSLIVIMACGLYIIYCYNLPNWIAIFVILIIVIFDVISLIKASMNDEVVSNLDLLGQRNIEYHNIINKIHEYYLNNKTNVDIKKIYEMLRYKNDRNINLSELNQRIDDYIAGKCDYDTIKKTIEKY